ncbi:MAG: hypothetical protein R3359_05135 [Marinirhabdus sp.]|nr:hypothetical protein [Marinirhabdus sp.]
MAHPIFKKIEESEKPDFGDVLTNGFNAVKEMLEPAILHGLLNLLIMIPVLLAVYIPFAPLYVDMITHLGDSYYQPEFDYTLSFMILYMLGIFAFTLVAQVFSFALIAHFYAVIRAKDLNLEKPAGGYFSYLKGSFGKIFLINLAAMGIATVAALLCYLPLFYVMVPLQLFTVLFAFNQDLTVSDLIRAAFKLGNKYWLILFGVIIISSVIAQLGLVACFVGIFITQLFVHLPLYYAYKSAIGFSETTH